MEHKKLPQTMRERVTDFLDKRYRGHHFDERKILNELSDVLRNDILQYSCRALVHKVGVLIDSLLSSWRARKPSQNGKNQDRQSIPRLQVPAFVNMGENFNEEVIRKLRHEYFQPGDAIIRGGSCGTKMYLLESGNVFMALLDGSTIAHLKDGACFGGSLSISVSLPSITDSRALDISIQWLTCTYGIDLPRLVKLAAHVGALFFRAHDAMNI